LVRRELPSYVLIVTGDGGVRKLKPTPGVPEVVKESRDETVVVPVLMSVM
jgi:hypothetical protein